MKCKLVLIKNKRMADLSLINRVKYSRWLYFFYYYTGSFVLRLIRIFVKSDEYLIVFNSFGGRRFDDSPKNIYDALLVDKRFDSYRLIWAFISPDEFSIPRGIKVKIDTLKYFVYLLKARVWITNSSVERGLSFRGKKTLYLNTWHGTAIKRMGTDISSDSKSFKSKAKESIDIMLAQGQYDVELFSRVFNIPKNKFRITGLPRNDELIAKNNPCYIDSLRQTLKIPEGKKVILYAPTFREYTKDRGHNVIQSIPLSLNRLKRELGGDFVFLLRAHYEVFKVMDVHEDSFIRNVSSYPHLNDLMLITDILISDYSSLLFDYSILERPMLCFAYDYQEYHEKRGLYFDVREALHSYIDDEESLISEIKKTSTETDIYIQRTNEFRNSFVTEYGNASHKCLDIVYDVIKNV